MKAVKKKEISFTLNGNEVSVAVSPDEKLLDVLRGTLGVTSPKYGCGKGECGACTVLMNGKTVRSCIMLAVQADQCEIVTLEGFQKNGMTDIQETFLKHNAFQCGFCAPGFILSTDELLRDNPEPDEEEIREALAGNLCRCTGYKNIIEAVEEMVENRKEGAKR
ncbi:MAG: (2Fe-2S)-binding protein [Spirochaetota bacterium]|nr:(2Fe-2S)-binding protein [Spirochaetota bacterium]